MTKEESKSPAKRGSIKQERIRRKKRKRRLITLAVILFLLATLALVVVKVFTVEQVEVEGNVLYEDAQIESTILNDEYSWNSLYVYFKYKLFPMEPVPFIDTVEVTLKSPHVVHVRVYEKGMLGYVSIPEEGNAYFDKDGFVTEISWDLIPDVPQILGIEVEEVVLYKNLTIKSGELNDILILTQALKRASLIPDSITYGVANAPVLTYGDIVVLLGDETLLTKKMERLSKIYPTLVGKKGELHMENWTEESTNIIFVEALEEPETEEEEAEGEEPVENPSENPN